MAKKPTDTATMPLPMPVDADVEAADDRAFAAAIVKSSRDRDLFTSGRRTRASYLLFAMLHEHHPHGTVHTAFDFGNGRLVAMNAMIDRVLAAVPEHLPIDAERVLPVYQAIADASLATASGYDENPLASSPTPATPKSLREQLQAAMAHSKRTVTENPANPLGSAPVVSVTPKPGPKPSS